MGNRKKSSSKKKLKINQQTKVSTATVVDTMARATLHRPNDDSRPQARESPQRTDAGNNPPTATESQNQAPPNDTGHTGASGIPPDIQRPNPANVTPSTVGTGSNTPVSERPARVLNNNNNMRGNSEPNSTCVPIVGDDSIGQGENTGNKQAAFHNQKTILVTELLNAIGRMESSNLFPDLQFAKWTPDELLDNLATSQNDISSLLPDSTNQQRNVSFNENGSYSDVVQNRDVSQNTDARQTNNQNHTDGNVTTDLGINTSLSRDSSSSVASTHTIQKLEQVITNLKREFAQVASNMKNHQYTSPKYNKLNQTARSHGELIRDLNAKSKSLMHIYNSGLNNSDTIDQFFFRDKRHEDQPETNELFYI